MNAPLKEAGPKKDTGKCPAVELEVPVPKKHKTASSKLMADAQKSTPSKAAVEEQVVGPVQGANWTAKYGTLETFKNEQIINVVDEKMSELKAIQKKQSRVPAAIHIQRSKADLLEMYSRLRAVETEIIQNVADKATIESLEKEASLAAATLAEKETEIGLKRAALARMEDEISQKNAELSQKDSKQMQLFRRKALRRM
ncbi:uncharacterized protein [Euphorbia lathyris]|uniref:uncharacterized protein n=1 Tax=Euphorbia lathyris TaxID=212925 RepID=UPI00331389C1